MKDLAEKIATIRELEVMSASMLVVKLFEEGGELAEATLMDAGFCQHKEDLKERAMGECADVFICVLGIMARLDQHKEYTPQELIDQFNVELNRKFAKYVNIMEMPK